MLTIRRANGTDNEGKSFAELVLMSATYFNTLFGKRIEYILERLFSLRYNLFSFEHVYIAEYNGELEGMLLGYDYETKKRENFRTGLLLFKYSGFYLLRKVKVLLNFNNTVGKLEKDEFYISNVAVYPEYRGKGIGRRLMLESENYAVKRKIKRMVLDVEKDNVPAISLYKKLGYEVDKEFTIAFDKEVLSFYRMKKSL